MTLFTPRFVAKDRAEWRAWLEKHHASEPFVWLVSPRKHLAEVAVRYDEAVEEALCFGWIDGVIGKVDEGHFAHRYTPRKPRSIWSKANVERVLRLTEVGRMTPAGQRVVDLAKASGAWDLAYATRDRVELPPELAAALGQQRGARALFEALTPGQKNAWSRIVLSVKTPEARARKANEVVLLFRAGRKAGETDAQAARRGVPSKQAIAETAASSGARDGKR